MARKILGSLLMVCMAVFCGTLSAQRELTKTITLRVFDGKSGRPLKPSGYQIRVDHQQMQHNDWVKQNEDGTADLTIPADASLLAVHLAYDNSMDIYVNCDAEKNAFGDVWYTVSQIMSKGLVMSNGCGKAKVNDKFKTTAAPGELILFVRERNFKERMQD